MPGTWLMKIETRAKPRQKSTALAPRGMRVSTLARAGWLAALLAPNAIALSPYGSTMANQGRQHWFPSARGSDRSPCGALSARLDKGRDQGIGNRLLAGHVEAVGMAAL